MKRMIPVVVAVAILVTWVVLSFAFSRPPVRTCPRGSIRVHGQCVQLNGP